MFDFAFSEMLLTALVALIVLGPERLPRAARRLGRYLAQVRQWSHTLRQNLDVIPNDAAWQEMKHTAADLRHQINELKASALPAWERLPDIKTPADFGIVAGHGSNVPPILTDDVAYCATQQNMAFHSLSLRRRALNLRRQNKPARKTRVRRRKDRS